MRSPRPGSRVARWCARLAVGALGLGLFVASAPPARAEDDKAIAADLEEANRLEREIERLARGGMHADAIPLAEQALAIREKRLGPDDPKVASSLSDLGALYATNGDPLRAEPLLERAYDILKKSPRATPQQIGVTLANLAGLARGRGDIPKALANSRAAVAALEAAGPDAEGDLVSSLRGLALSSDPKQAAPIFDRALAIAQRRGMNEIAVLILTDLGTLERNGGRAPQAAQHYNDALELSQKTLGPSHPVVGNLLHRIGRFYHRDGNHTEAERYYQRASPILEAAYGPAHPVMADLLADWSLLREAAADIPGAVELRARANGIEESYLDLLIASGSEDAKRLYTAKLRRHLEETIWLHAGRGARDRGALRLALTTLLRRKGRVLDTLADDVAVLRDHLGPEEGSLLEHLARTRSDLSTLYVRGPGADARGYEVQRKALVAEESRLEATMSARSAELRAVTAPLTIEAVQAALPEGAALVEILRFQPHDARAYSEQGAPLGGPRYIAYVLKRTGEPRFTEVLANADDVDTVVDQVRARIQSSSNNSVYDAADRLDRLVMRRVNELLGDTRDVFLSPDGDLSLIPFGALIEGGHFLIDRFSFTYLTSGRDLVRLAARSAVPNRSAPMIFANPSYDKVNAPDPVSVARSRDAADRSGRARRQWSRSQNHEAAREAIDPRMVGYPRLPGTEAEAKAISKVVPGAVLRLGADADEVTLKAVSGPKFLHVATHGFFFGALEHGIPTLSGTRTRSVRIDDPLVLSGLALAGANLHPPTGEDGVLTALEASTLDLHGTELVVLSACETGLGKVTSGDGVRGLRRALVVAGAETQVMSLWKVDDDATRALMTSFYQQLFRDGAGRSEALRKAQLELIGKAATKHPFYWAAFIASGVAGPMAKEPRWTQPQKVASGPRGCSCEAVGGRDESLAGWGTMGALGLMLLRKRRRE